MADCAPRPASGGCFSSERRTLLSGPVVAERLRITRDLHDFVGHRVAVLNMHIGVAAVSLPPGAERAAAALVDARTAIQAVLRETQQILELLRRGDTALDDPGQPGTSPAPEQRKVAALV